MLLAALGAVLLVFLWGKAAVTGGLIEPASTVPPHENPLARMNFLQRLPAGLGILFDAAVQLVVPLGLSPDYSAVSLPVEDGWRWPLAWLGAMACLALRLRCAMGGGGGWMIAAAAVGCWLPLSNIFSPIGVVTAERLWYLPSAAACLGAGALLAAAWEAQPSAFAQRRTLRELPVVLLLAWLMTSLFYARAWRTQAGYAEWTVRRFPGSWRGHINLADADYHARQFTDGVIEGRRAVEIMPGIALGWDWRGLNAAFAGPQYWAEAEGALRRAPQLDARSSRRMKPALLYEMQGRRADAIREYEAYLAAGQADDGATIARPWSDCGKSDASGAMGAGASPPFRHSCVNDSSPEILRLRTNRRVETRACGNPHRSRRDDHLIEPASPSTLARGRVQFRAEIVEQQDRASPERRMIQAADSADATPRAVWPCEPNRRRSCRRA